MTATHPTRIHTGLAAGLILLAGSLAQAQERSSAQRNLPAQRTQSLRPSPFPPPAGAPPAGSLAMPQASPFAVPPSGDPANPGYNLQPPGLQPPGLLPQMPPQMSPQMPPQMSPTGPAMPPPVPLRDMSWIYIDRAPPPRKVKVHDIIKVLVKEQSQVTQDSRFNRQRNIIFNAQLKEFIRIDGDGNLEPAATNQPAINGQLRSQLNSLGQANSSELMVYRIAATVVDVLPNGTLILEARKSITTNRDVWQYSLTGRVRSEDIGANNEVQSENVADLNIIKRETGKIRDSTKRGFIMWIYDLFLPF